MAETLRYNFMGAYKNDVQYVSGDVVRDGGKLMYCVSYTATTGTSLSDASKWLPWGEPGTAEHDMIEQALARNGSATLDARMDGAEANIQSIDTQLGYFGNSQLKLKNNSGYFMRNYLSNSGKIFSDFENTADWSNTASSTGTVTADTNHYKCGIQSLKLSVTTSGGNSQADRTISLYLGGTSKEIRLWSYFHDDPADYLTVFIYMSSQSDYSKTFTCDIKTLQPIKQGWNYIVIRPEQWNNSTGDSFENKMIRLRLKVSAASGKTPSVSFDQFVYGTVGEARVIFRFDDGSDNVFSTAYPIMEAKNFKGVSYVVPSTISVSSTVMTIEQLNELYEKGWDISNHSNTHSHFDSMTTEQIASDISEAQDWLLSHGFTKSAKHVAVPFGEMSNGNTLQALASVGCLTATNSSYDVFYPQRYDLINLPSEVILNSNALYYAVDLVEQAITYGKTVILMFHNIVESPTNDYQWSTSKFQALVDYIYNRGVAVVTMSDWYAGL